MSSKLVDLIIDKEDTYGDKDILFMFTNHLSNLYCVAPNTLKSATIKNCPVDELNTYNLTNLFSALKNKSKVEVILNQPIEVMQELDARQIISNAELCGFSNLKTSDIKISDEKTKKKFDSLVISFIKDENAKKEADNNRVNNSNIIMTSGSSIVKSTTSNVNVEKRNSRTNSKKTERTNSRRGTRNSKSKNKV